MSTYRGNGGRYAVEPRKQLERNARHVLASDRTDHPPRVPAAPNWGESDLSISAMAAHQFGNGYSSTRCPEHPLGCVSIIDGRVAPYDFSGQLGPVLSRARMNGPDMSRRARGDYVMRFEDTARRYEGNRF